LKVGKRKDWYYFMDEEDGRKAIKLLREGGIQVNKEEAKAILDFLYLIAKTYSKQMEMESLDELEPGDESNSKFPILV
jgi:hypothetical protein